MRSRPARRHKSRAALLRRELFRLQLAGWAMMRVTPQRSHLTAEHRERRVRRLRSR